MTEAPLDDELPDELAAPRPSKSRAEATADTSYRDAVAYLDRMHEHTIQVARDNKRLRDDLASAKHADWTWNATGYPKDSISVDQFRGFFVYNLIRRDAREVVYIGKTINLLSRVTRHMSKFSFDRVMWETLPSEATMELRETELIHELHPVLNRQCVRCPRRQNPRAVQEAELVA